jgi:hypothetical protein
MLKNSSRKSACYVKNVILISLKKSCHMSRSSHKNLNFPYFRVISETFCWSYIHLFPPSFFSEKIENTVMFAPFASI